MERGKKIISQVKQKDIFDLGIAWNWEYDADFIFQINEVSLELGLKPYLIHPFNLDETIKLLRKGVLEFRAFFDRASDTNANFSQLVHLLQQKGVFFVNHPERIKWINNKILIHMEFMLNKIPVPPTFIHYPSDEPQTTMNKINQIGTPFVIKPAHYVDTGGEEVLVNAISVEEIIRWQNQYRDFIFLVQKQIIPITLDKNPAWFRVFYIFGQIIPCWWHPSTHIYEIVTKDEISKFRLNQLFTLTKKIGKIYKLGFFSTEIAMEKNSRFVVIDYINDQCDMRKKSKHIDGVCDETIDLIVRKLVETIKKTLNSQLNHFAFGR